MLHNNICLLWASLLFVYCFWTWLWAQHFLYCVDFDLCLGICCGHTTSNCKFLDFILLHKVFKHWSGSIWSCWIFNKQVHGSILPASVLSLYCMYLCYSGLASEPRDYECNGLHNKSEAVSTSTLTVGLLITVLSVVYSAVRAGSSTSLLSPPDSPRAGQHLSSLQLQFSLLVIWIVWIVFKSDVLNFWV